jgi:hypothetical protein
MITERSMVKQNDHFAHSIGLRIFSYISKTNVSSFTYFGGGEYQGDFTEELHRSK